MQASKQTVALNARVDRKRRRALDLAVARRGITTQKAVEEAIDLWLAHYAPRRVRGEVSLPLIKSDRPGTIDLTNEQIDEIIFG